MSAWPKAEPYIDVEEYLELETASPFRHELMDGVMYAMAGGSEEHHALENALLGMLYVRLRGRLCRGYGTNMKLRMRSQLSERDYDFVYPDAMVCCDPNDGGTTHGHAWRAKPSVIFEILSPSTRRVDENRKRPAYLSISSLDVLVLIEQDRPELHVSRRLGGEWIEERILGLDKTLRLPSVQLELPLAELYERVVFTT